MILGIGRKHHPFILVPHILDYSNAISDSSFLGQEKGRIFNPSGKREV